MKKRIVYFGVAVLMIALTGQALAGIFDELFKPQQSQSEEEAPGQEKKGLVDGLGDLFGVKKEEVDLLKKGLGVVESLQPIGEEEEITIGQAVALEAFSRFDGAYTNEALVRYVNLVGRTIADVSDRPNLHYKFAILNSLEQNAFAAPGGYIFVTIGLLKTLSNEAELAGVLAHEIAHVTQQHMLKTIRRGAILSNVSEFTMAAMKKDPEMFAGVIDEATNTLFNKGLDKELEYEADALGIEYAYRAGYNPNGLKNYLNILHSQHGKAESRFFSTHPPTKKRLRKVKKQLRNYEDGSSFPTLTTRFMASMEAS